MGGPRDYHFKQNRKINITCYHLYVESENNANELIYKTNPQKYKTNLQSPKGKVGKERN